MERSILLRMRLLHAARWWLELLKQSIPPGPRLRTHSTCNTGIRVAGHHDCWYTSQAGVKRARAGAVALGGRFVRASGWVEARRSVNSGAYTPHHQAMEGGAACHGIGHSKRSPSLCPYPSPLGQPSPGAHHGGNAEHRARGVTSLPARATPISSHHPPCSQHLPLPSTSSSLLPPSTLNQSQCQPPTSCLPAPAWLLLLAPRLRRWWVLVTLRWGRAVGRWRVELARRG